jgi:hypothetical protein
MRYARVLVSLPVPSVYERVFLGINPDNVFRGCPRAGASKGRSLHVIDREKSPRNRGGDNAQGRQGSDMRNKKVGMSLKEDRAAGIEGLPLQLLIMVVVAGLGLTIIMGWMNSISAPHAIGEVFVNPGEILVYDVDGDGLYDCSGVTVTVTVTDEGGDRLEGATVMLDGANVRHADGTAVRGVTDAQGQILFTNLKVEQFGSGLSTITVTVAKGDYGIDSSFEIPVIPS